MLGDRPRRVRPRTFVPFLSRADARPIAGLLAVGIAVYAVYVLTNDYPAYGAGLFALIAEEILAHGYGLPETIPYYAPDGVPFAYPPLGFYLFAVVLDLTGADLLTVSRLLPGLYVVVSTVPAYLLGRELLGSRRRGAFAGLLVALNPQVLEWHISAGGVVRAPAFLLLLSGLAVGVGLFRVGGRRRLVAATVLFGLTVLAHPTYTTVFGLSYVLFWLALDRTPVGLLRGAAVAAGGGLLASPWLLSVLATHGPDVYLSAAGTHGGIGGGATHLLTYGPTIPSLVPIVAALALLPLGHVLLPAWLALMELGYKQSRFSYTVGSVVIVAAAAEYLAPAVRERLADAPTRKVAALTVAGWLVVAGAGVGYLGYHFTLGDDDTTPEFVDDEDVAAMEWAANGTDRNATFVVLGDAAEWFPALTSRTILVGPWGAEWQGSDTYWRQLHAYENASTCERPQCVDDWLSTVDAEPNYLYVPKGTYTVRGDREENASLMIDDLRHRYAVAYENEGVVVFRYSSNSGTASAMAQPSPASASGRRSPRAA